MSKKLSIIVIIIMAIAAVWFYKNKSGQEVSAPTPAPAANSAEVVKEVESIDLGDVDSEFEQIDKDLDTL